MQKITLKFLLANILTSIFLILNSGDWVIKYDEFMHHRNVGLGVGLLVIFVIGFFIRYKMATISAYNAKNNISKVERIFLAALFLFALTGTINFTFMANNNIFGEIEEYQGYKMYLGITLVVVSFFLIMFEGVLIFAKDEFKLKKPKHQKVYTRLYQYYIGIGVSISWNMMMIGNSKQMTLDMPNFWSELIATIFLVIMLVFPFQRFFWYEVFSASKTIKDNLIVIGSLIMVIASAVVPLFYL